MSDTKSSFVYPVENPTDDCVRAMVKDLFTVQERGTMAEMLSRGHIDHIGAALQVENPERAYWLDKYLALKRPKAEPVESKVREELRKYEAEFGLDTPEKAAFWDARLQLERDGQPLPPLRKALKELDLVVDSPADELDEDEKSLSKAEIIEQLEAKGIEFDASLKKAELKLLLEA